MGWLAPVLGAASAVFNAGASGNMNKKNRAHAEKMQQAQMNYQTEMWNKSNEYNSLTNQRKRMEEAGMNPALMYGNGAGLNAGNAGGPGGGSAPTASTEAPKLDPVMAAHIGKIHAETEEQKLINKKHRLELGDEQPEMYSISYQQGQHTMVIEKRTDNQYYRRMKAEADKAVYDKDVSKLSSDLAQKGYTVNDPKLLRILESALQQEGTSTQNATRFVIRKIFKKLGFN